MLDPGPSIVPLHLRMDARPDIDENTPSLPRSTLTQTQPSQVGSSASKRVTFALPQLENVPPSQSESDEQVRSQSVVSESTVETREPPSSFTSTKCELFPLSEALHLLMHVTASERIGAAILRPPYSYSSNAFYWSVPASTAESLLNSIEESNRSRVVYRDPYYSNPRDIPSMPRIYGGRSFRLQGNTIKDLAPFKHWSASSKGIGRPRAQKRAGITQWEYNNRPPTRREASAWIETDAASRITRAQEVPSQVNATLVSAFAILMLFF